MSESQYDPRTHKADGSRIDKPSVEKMMLEAIDFATEVLPRLENTLGQIRTILEREPKVQALIEAAKQAEYELSLLHPPEIMRPLLAQKKLREALAALEEEK